MQYVQRVSVVGGYAEPTFEDLCSEVEDMVERHRNLKVVSISHSVIQDVTTRQYFGSAIIVFHEDRE